MWVVPEDEETNRMSKYKEHLRWIKTAYYIWCDVVNIGTLSDSGWKPIKNPSLTASKHQKVSTLASPQTSFWEETVLDSSLFCILGARRVTGVVPDGNWLQWRPSRKDKRNVEDVIWRNHGGNWTDLQILCYEGRYEAVMCTWNIFMFLCATGIRGVIGLVCWIVKWGPSKCQWNVKRDGGALVGQWCGSSLWKRIMKGNEEWICYNSYGEWHSEFVGQGVKNEEFGENVNKTGITNDGTMQSGSENESYPWRTYRTYSESDWRITKTYCQSICMDLR